MLQKDRGRENPISFGGSGKVPGPQNIILKGAWGSAREGGGASAQVKAKRAHVRATHSGVSKYRWAMSIQRWVRGFLVTVTASAKQGHFWGCMR